MGTGELGLVGLIALVVAAIGAIANAIVTVVNGVRIQGKLATIAKDVDGNLTAVKQELKTAQGAVAALHSVVLEQHNSPGAAPASAIIQGGGRVP